MIQTVLGPADPKELGAVLPHEHIMVGFIKDGKLTRDDYDPYEVVEIMLPYLLRLKETGIKTFVDCSPAFLGRDPEILKELSKRSGLHILTNTGYYQQPYLAPFVYDIDEKALADIWIEEGENGIGASGVKPGFIKIALNSGKINPVQQKILRAAVRTSQKTGLVIQAHTIGGEAILHAQQILEEKGFDAEGFIWVHADSEDDFSYHEKAGGKGMWIEVDSIGSRPYEEHCRILQHLMDLGLEDQLLISQDSGWYNIGQPQGGSIKPYHRLMTEFIPFALQWGIEGAVFDKLIRSNPAKALRIRA